MILQTFEMWEVLIGGGSGVLRLLTMDTFVGFGLNIPKSLVRTET